MLGNGELSSKVTPRARIRSQRSVQSVRGDEQKLQSKRYYPALGWIQSQSQSPEFQPLAMAV